MANTDYDIRKYDLKIIEKDYENVVGKTESMYVVVLLKCKVEQLLEYTASRSQNAAKIKDSHRKGRARKAYYNLKEFAESLPEDDILNYLIMMDVEKNIVDIFSLTSGVINRLSEYECHNIWLRCTDHFDLTELKDYLESDEYYNLFRVKNNKVKHIKLGRTKKYAADSEESKSLDLSTYIASRIDTSTKFLAYGSSSKLAPLNNSDIRPRAYDVINRDISDSDAIDYISRMDQSDLLDKMEGDYELTQNPKTMHRIVFKKDFKPDKIAILQRIYIDRRMLDKFYENCKRADIDISFEIVVIDHTIRDFQDNRESRLMTEFGGVMGVTYY
jgi:hypothetical protein